jgi:hypothetical protein
MTLGNIIQIEAKGPEDLLLYGNPQVSYFRQVYKRSTNFAMDYFKIAENYFIHADFGSTVKIKLPMRADLLGGLYLKVKFTDLQRVNNYYNPDGTFTKNPQFTSYVNGIGFNFIEEVKLIFNGSVIEKMSGELIFLYNELHNSQNRKKSFYRMTRFYEDSFRIGYTNTKDVMTYIHIPFFFTRDPSVYLPICSMSNTEINIEIKLKPLNKCLVRQYNYTGDLLPGVNGFIDSETPRGTVPDLYGMYEEQVIGKIDNVELYLKNIFLDKEERAFFKKTDFKLLIELLNLGISETLNEPTERNTFFYPLDFCHPTKYVFWILQREDVFNANFYDNYTTSFNIKYGDGVYTFDYDDHLIENGVILANNQEISPVTDEIFLSSVQLYDNFRTGTDYNIYNYNFALNPCSHNPQGSLNFSKILRKDISISLVSPTKFTNNNYKPNILLRTFSHSFNFLIVKDGLAGLIYKQ